MKKSLATILTSLFMAAVLAMSLLASAKSNVKHCSTAADLGSIVMDGYNRGEKGSIQIVQGKYTSNQGNTMDVYVVTVSGTENEVPTLSNSGLSLDFAALNIKNSPYYYRIKTVIRENIPKGSRIFFVGHSLGGMMTQQLATDKDLKKEYIIKFDLVFAGPYTQPGEKREGGIARLGDWSDIIPFETGNLLTHPKETVTYSREYGGYGINFWTAHMNSYMNQDVWGEYDVTGKKGGKATLDLDMSTHTFYKSDYILILQDLIQELN
ncbi:MAG: hypothetical protein IJ230_07685 [Clostridia bacterium]|nr:hypothetical protein [Clostridia bacterium]